MTVYNIDADVGEREIKRNVAEGQSEKEKKSRLKNFCSKLWDSTKRTTQVLAIAVGMTVMAYGCGGKVHPSGDVDIDNIEIIDGENDADVDGLEDVLDVEVETNCIGPSEPLEGEVDPLLANTETEGATLDGSDSEVFGDTETTVGGVVESDSVLQLGQCPNDPNSVAAFGAYGGSISVAGQYRIDLGGNTFYAELPDVDSDVCPPPEVDNVPISMYLDETNLAVKEATVGSIDTRGEFSFVTPLIPLILVNGFESASPVALYGSGYDVKAIMVSLENPLLDMAAKVYSNTGEEILTREVNGSVSTVNSKTLKIYQISFGDRITPNVSWDVPTLVKLCLRSESGDPKEVDLEINGDAMAAAMDSCGKIYGAFDIDSLTAEIVTLSPPHLRANYSVVAVTGSGLDAMSEGKATVTLTLRREASVPDIIRERVGMEIRVGGNVVSREDNPAAGVPDSVSFTMPLAGVIDPDAADYISECGYFPGGIF